MTGVAAPQATLSLPPPAHADGTPVVPAPVFPEETDNYNAEVRGPRITHAAMHKTLSILTSTLPRILHAGGHTAAQGSLGRGSAPPSGSAAKQDRAKPQPIGCTAKCTASPCAAWFRIEIVTGGFFARATKATQWNDVEKALFRSGRSRTPSLPMLQSRRFLSRDRGESCLLLVTFRPSPSRRGMLQAGSTVDQN